MRLALTAIIMLVYGFFRLLWAPFKSSIEAQMAVKQLSDDVPTYAIARAWAMQDLVTALVTLVMIVLLLVVWMPGFLHLLKKLGAGRGLGLLLVFLVLPAASCVPYKMEPYEEIQPNETAFLVPLEGATQSGQAKFMSLEYLEQAKIATKRVTIPLRERQRGYGWWNIEYLPTMKVIKVDRTPLVREWTKAADTGTSPTNQAFKVESSESIDFWVGGVAAASIREEDAAKFLYYFAGKPLKDVMDSNVRNMVQKTLFDEFGSLSLEEGKTAKREIFGRTEKLAREALARQGVTIDYIGGSEGMTYADPKVQTAINRNFEAQQDRIRAEAEKAAQEVRNQNDLEVERTAALKKQIAADADASAFRTRGQAEVDIMSRRGEQLARFPQLVDLAAAERYKGDVPETLVVGQGSVPPVFLSPQRR